MQNALRISSPLIGGLFQENRLDDNPKLTFREGRLIECELGIFSDIHGNVQAICPAIEFAVLDFEKKTEINIFGKNFFVYSLYNLFKISHRYSMFWM